ncbi:MAG TPA: SDR family NAD(P)-dependent oxidoreductase [Stellaceae bacterium]|jgi:NAD(P)-dependent dehydrogenase (short-subunit alcohol dehydrogenase family)
MPTAIVTGASAGIGLYTALGLAERGMRVVMVGRDPARTEAAQRFVASRTKTAPEIVLTDFSSLVAVRTLTEALLVRCDRIDVLVNNAGLISPHRANSADGIEMTIAVNHLAPFLLTNLLLARLKASAPARIVNVASTAHRGAWIDPATMADPPEWTPLSAYGRSKLCNILFTRALARRLQGSGVTATCLHPGVIATDIGNRAGGLAALGWRIAKPFLKSAKQGAATSLFLATVPDPTAFAGAYVVGRKIAGTDPAARDDRLGERLWTESTRLVGL